MKKNEELMFKAMRLAQIQLHQGRHSGSKTYGIGKWPYKVRVNLYLDKIKLHAVAHYAGKNFCEYCRGEKKQEIPT